MPIGTSGISSRGFVGLDGLLSDGLENLNGLFALADLTAEILPCGSLRRN
jgi:hypothetical protein